VSNCTHHPAPARLRHLPRLAGILWAHQRESDWLPRVRSRGADLGAMARIIRRGWVRQLPGAHGPAGFIARDGSVIYALYVHPRARGQGTGRRLVDEAKAATDRLELWTAQANTAARRFYRAQGFVEVAATDGQGNDENLPDVLCVWQRSAACE
jgi:GNAT superfamily N-acetyltransferase